MNLTAEQLSANFNELLDVIGDLASPRREQLAKLHQDHQERIMMMPASGTLHYHNCWPGGYVDHVIRVAKLATLTNKFWAAAGATINFTEEELLFAAICHDLGKIGTEQAEQYIPNDSKWHRENQGKMYNNNPANAFMTVPDRSLKLLTDRNIPVSENEWFAIKLHDGMYEEANKPYYVSYNPESRLRSNIAYILHQADMMASRIENDMRAKAASEPTVEDQNKQKLAQAFHKLF